MIYDSMPDGFRPDFELVTCLLEHDGKCLLVQRSPGDEHGNKWSIPGGKVEKGETKEEAVKREILEELGVVSGHFTSKGQATSSFIMFSYPNWAISLP